MARSIRIESIGGGTRGVGGGSMRGSFAKTKTSAKKIAVSKAITTGTKGSVRQTKKSINEPKTQRRFENLVTGSNTRTSYRKSVPVKKKAK